MRGCALLAAACIVLGLAGCGGRSQPSTDISPLALRTWFTPIAAYREEPAMESRIRLGRRLYYDKRLSAGENTSCDSCHLLASYGADGHPVSTGHDGRTGARNSPTVYNAGLNFVQFWDGRAADLAEQAKGPLLNPVEMGMPDGSAVAARIKGIPGYEQEFAAVFPRRAAGQDPVTFDHAVAAIAAFEEGLLTPGRWDRYLEGEESALSGEEKRGLQLFLKTGCASCHAGRALGGNSFQKAGFVGAWPDQHDLGRYQVTSLERDRLVFKVPMLRNIEKTGPYFSDGSVASLSQAVELMARYQCGARLGAGEVDQIVAFLHALTGPLPGAYIAPDADAAVGPPPARPNDTTEPRP